MIVHLFYFFVLSLGAFKCSNVDYLHQIFESRTKILRNYALNSLVPTCSELRYISVSDGPWGGSGNNLIEFAHLLWLTKILNATLIVPSWIMDILVPFNTSLLQTHFCMVVTNNSVSYSAKNVKAIAAEEAFFVMKVWGREKEWKIKLPPLNKETILDISLHFLRVYAALWSSPSKELVDAGKWIISQHLDFSCRYTSVHKRQMEGKCNNIMYQNARISDFSPQEVPLDREDWRNHRNHPLCEMPLDFIRQVQELNHKSKSKIFISFDGRGNTDSYRNEGVVFGDCLKKSSFSNETIEDMYVDMFVAIHSEFFILNPRSTFSWGIFLVRVVLGLPSVPVVRTNDFYYRFMPHEALLPRGQLWVSWTSVLEAFKRKAVDRKSTLTKTARMADSHSRPFGKQSIASNHLTNVQKSAI